MTIASPFVKAAGGKSKLLPEIMTRAPSFQGAYHEPFLGGGSVFLAIAAANPEKTAAGRIWANLSDANPELMNAYEVVRSHSEKLCGKLKALKASYSQDTYYAVRSREETEPVARAARFIFLNKICFNGLYRVNSKGKFNVPFGKYKNPRIYDPEVLSIWGTLLLGAAIRCEDFGASIGRSAKGDFLYADPPYLPRSKTADFTSYTSDKFTLSDHERLAASLVSASGRGALFLCSQGDSPAIRSLYKGFSISQVSVRHTVGAKAASRGKVDEVLIQNYA